MAATLLLLFTEKRWPRVNKNWLLDTNPEQERKKVTLQINQGKSLPVIRAYILYLLLRYKYASSSGSRPIPQERKEIPTELWIQLIFNRLSKMGARIPIENWKYKDLSTGDQIPYSPLITRALETLAKENLVETKSATKNEKTFEGYHLTVWGDSYLKKVYIPVLNDLDLLKEFTPIVKKAFPALLKKSFMDLVRERDIVFLTP